jgi:hypothetical protein
MQRGAFIFALVFAWRVAYTLACLPEFSSTPPPLPLFFPITFKPYSICMQTTSYPILYPQSSLLFMPLVAAASPEPPFYLCIHFFLPRYVSLLLILDAK